MFRISVVITFLLSALNCLGQPDSLHLNFTHYGNRPLEEVLSELTNDYGVVFSYSPAAIQGIETPTFSRRKISISEFLTRVLVGSPLDFEVISDTYVLLTRADVVDTVRTHFSITGVVRDVASEESLPYATISVRGTELVTTANSEGRFSLLDVPSDTSLIEVRYLGYSPIVVRANTAKTGSVPAVFGMKRRSRQLPSVEILAKPEEMVEIHRQPGKFTFNASDISTLPNLGEADIFAALRRLPGIGGDQPPQSGLRIRGSGSGENLVMFDGIPIYHIDHFFGYFSAFNTPMIKNVQIYKGGFGAKFGGRTSGVVDVVGIDGNKISPEFQAELNTMSISFLGQLPLVENKASLVVAYRRSITDFWLSPTFRNMFNRLYNAHVPAQGAPSVDVFDTGNTPEFHYEDFNAKLSFKPSALDAVAVSFYSGSDHLNISFDQEERGIRRVSRDVTDWGNTGGSFKWARMWSRRFSTSAIVGISRYESGLNSNEDFYTDGELFSSTAFEQNVVVDDHTIRLDQAVEISDRSKLEFGWWYTGNTVLVQAQDASVILRDSSITGHVNSGYVSYRHRIGAFQTEMGIRGNHYDRTGKVYFAPRWSGSLRINEHIELKGAAGVHYQMIRRLNERSLYLSIPETWTMADPETVPVGRSDHYQLEVHAEVSGWSFVVGGYHKYERGTVEFPLPEFGPPTGETDRLAIDGRRRILGADLLVEKSMNHQNILFSYGFIHAESKYAGIEGGKYFLSPGVAKHELSGIYSLQYKRWEFSTALTWTFGMPYTPILGVQTDTLTGGQISQSLNIGLISSKYFQPAHRMDVSVNYTVPLKKGMLEVGASIYNIYNDRPVVMIDYYAIPRQGSELYDLGRREVRGLGITPSLFLKLRI